MHEPGQLKREIEYPNKKINKLPGFYKGIRGMAADAIGQQTNNKQQFVF